MRFGIWHPIESAAKFALETPGVLQTRAEGVLDYEQGLSAMVYYAHSGAQESLKAFVTGRGAAALRRAAAAGARWIRFAEAPAPEPAYDELIAAFSERFGSLPLANRAKSA